MTELSLCLYLWRLLVDRDFLLIGEPVDLLIDLLSQVFPDGIGHGEKNLHGRGIELASAPALNFGARRRDGLGRAVGTIAGDGVVRSPLPRSSLPRGPVHRGRDDR